jgi:hypothetical protein
MMQGIPPVQLAAEVNIKMGSSSNVAPIFMCNRGNPKGSQVPGALSLVRFFGQTKK